MADSAELDTGQDTAEKSSVDEAKTKKDETNEKIKTENQENISKEDNGDDTKVENTEPNATTEASDSQAKDEPNESNQKEQKSSKPEPKEHKTNKRKTSKKEKKTVEEPADVKFLQIHYKTHAKSTLPHILTEYGLEDKDLKDKKEKKKKKKVVEKIDDSDSGLQSHKKTESQFQNVFGGRPTDTYYMEYIDFLEQKVIQQRLKAQREKEEAEKLRLQHEEEEDVGDEKITPTVSEVPDIQRKHRFTRRLERIELKHDDSFLKNLPKTDTARIIALQDKLMKEGKLKNQIDVDKFWDDIRKPKVFYEHFKVNKKDTGHDHLHLNSNTNGQNDEQELGPRGLSHISEASKASEPWAITQKFQSQHSTSPKSPSTERKRKDSTQMSRDAASELEKRCPKLEMPPLACFSLKLGDKPPDPEAITKRLELKTREKTRKKFQRKLNKMYQMAMTNTAAANRILAQHGDLTNILEGAALRDVLAVFDEPYQTLEDYYREMLDPSRGLVDQPDELVSQMTQSRSGTEHTTSTRHSSAGSRRLTPISDTASKPGTLSRRKKKSPEMIEYPAPLPLSFDEVFTKEKTIEPKCVSTLWTNYMHAGKSAFAQS